VAEDEDNGWGSGGGGHELCMEFYFIAKLCFHVFASCACGWGQKVSPKRYACFYVFTFWKMCLWTQPKRVLVKSRSSSMNVGDASPFLLF
jgi:hypothetical protein